MISYNAIRKNKTLLQVLPLAAAVAAFEEDSKKKAEVEAKEKKSA